MHNFFQKKDSQKERIARRVWALALMVSVGNRLVTLILFIAAILPFWLFCLSPRKLLKDFSELNPNLFPAFLLVCTRFSIGLATPLCEVT
jgi:hypothetical protein